MTPSESKLTDTIDLMRDEFRRIVACPSDKWAKAEIDALCERAIAKIEQNVPVITQRDNAEKQARRYRAALQEIADETQRHHEHNPISGKDRLPRGYTNILNLADAALNK